MLHPTTLKDKDEFGFPRNFAICRCEDNEATFDQRWIERSIEYRRFLEGNSELRSWKSGDGRSFSEKLERAIWLDGCDSAHFKETSIWTCIMEKRRYDAYMPEKITLSTGSFKGLQIELEAGRYRYDRPEIKILDQNSDWNIYDEACSTSNGVAFSLGSSHRMSQSKKKYSVTADVTTDAQKPYTAGISLKIPLRKWDRDTMKFGDPEILHVDIGIDVSTSGKHSRATVGGSEATILYRDPQLPF
jgi:hypothetical protein